MGVRMLALVLLLTACSAKQQSTQTKGKTTKTIKGSGGTTATATPTTTPPPTATPGIAPPSTAPAQSATLAEVGLEAASLDRSVDPCVDFYQFACGGWLGANQIPADRALWARFFELDEKNKTQLRLILEDAAPKPELKKLGDFYASCMDEAGVEKAGTAALRPLLDKTTKIKDPKSWTAALTELHKVGVWVVFRSWAEASLNDSTTYVTQVDSGALGLPDREYYLKADFKPQLEGYTQHVARMLALAGVAKAEAAANDVIAIESELAKLTKTATEKRDPQAMNNYVDLKKLAKQTKSIDWKGYYKTLGITPSAKIENGTPKFLAGLDGLRKRFKPAQWSGYFTYHLLLANARSLPMAFDEEAFALEKLVSGTSEQSPRWRRCIEATSESLGELLGRAYVDKHFPAQARQSATTLVDAIAVAMHDEIGKLDWMTDKTKQVAQQKLTKIVKMNGFPDKWRTYDFEVKRDDFAGNSLRAAAFDVRRILSRGGKQVDRTEWPVNTFVADAFYNPSANNTILPAGLLQPPFFGANRSIAANLGGIGMVIGHELTHGFDTIGAQFDASGNLVNWWAPEDKAKFDAKGKCLAAQYDSFEALPKQFVNGQLTLAENIADLGGVKMAFKAYRALRKDAQRVQIADGFTEDQQFFLAVGQAWCSKLRPAEAQRRLTTDSHAPTKFRVYGALRNLPEFSQAFQCAPGTPMYPAQTCTVW